MARGLALNHLLILMEKTALLWAIQDFNLNMNFTSGSISHARVFLGRRRILHHTCVTEQKVLL